MLDVPNWGEVVYQTNWGEVGKGASKSHKDMSSILSVNV